MDKRNLGLNSKAKGKFQDKVGNIGDEVSKIGYSGLTFDDVDSIYKVISDQFNSLYKDDPNKSLKTHTYSENLYRTTKSIFIHFDRFTDATGHDTRPSLVIEIYNWKEEISNVSTGKLYLNFKQDTAGTGHFNNRIIDLVDMTTHVDELLEAAIYAIRNISKIAGKPEIYPGAWRKKDYENFLKGFTQPGYNPGKIDTNTFSTEEEIEKWMTSEEMYGSGFNFLKFMEKMFGQDYEIGYINGYNGNFRTYRKLRIQYTPAFDSIDDEFRLKTDAGRWNGDMSRYDFNECVLNTLNILKRHSKRLASVSYDGNPIYNASFLRKLDEIWKDKGGKSEFVKYHFKEISVNSIINDSDYREAKSFLCDSKKGSPEFDYMKAFIKTMLHKKKNSKGAKALVAEIKACCNKARINESNLGLNKQAKKKFDGKNIGDEIEKFGIYGSLSETKKIIMKGVIRKTPPEWFLSSLSLPDMLQILTPSYDGSIVIDNGVFTLDFGILNNGVLVNKCDGNAKELYFSDDPEENFKTYQTILDIFMEFTIENLPKEEHPKFEEFVKARAHTILSLKNKDRIYKLIDIAVK